MNLLFITFSDLSDAVLSTGVLDRALRTVPGARVTIACGREAVPLFEAVPGLERIIVMGNAGPLSALALWLRCFFVPWSAIFDLRRTGAAGLMLTRRLRVMRKANPHLHRLMQFAQGLGMEHLPEPVIWTAEDHGEEATRLLPGTGPCLVLAPAARRPVLEWPQESFIALIESVTAKGGVLANARVVFVGPADARRRFRSLLEIVPKRQRIDLFGDLHLLVLAELARRAALFVGNDDPLMHIAAAAGCRTIALYGPTRDDVHGPWADHVRIVRTPETVPEIEAAPGYDPAGRHSQLGSITVAAVIKAATDLVKKRKGKAA